MLRIIADDMATHPTTQKETLVGAWVQLGLGWGVFCSSGGPIMTTRLLCMPAAMPERSAAPNELLSAYRCAYGKRTQPPLCRPPCRS